MDLSSVHLALSQAAGCIFLQLYLKPVVHISFPSSLCQVTSTWPQLRCDVGLEQGEYKENCLCATVLCTIITVHNNNKKNNNSQIYKAPKALTSIAERYKRRKVVTGRSTMLGLDL